MLAGALQPCDRFESENPLLASAARIGERLLATGFQGSLPTDLVPDMLAAGLADRARREFAADETVDCDGWVLSRSEAEFCIQCARVSAGVT
jgi:hypothetical protein